MTGDCPDEMTIMRLFTATDDCDNSDTCGQQITVQDMGMPMFLESEPNDTTVNCLSDVPASVVIPAEDNCGMMFMIGSTDEVSDSTCANKLTITRKWLVMDPCGNKDSLEQIITVNDTIPPEAMCMNFTVDVMGMEMIEILPENIDMGSFDGCGGDVSLEVVPSMFNCDTFADSVDVKLIATDLCLNKDTCDAKVYFQNFGMFDLMCPNDTCIFLEPGLCEGVINYEINTGVACGVSVEVTQTDDSGYTSGDVFPQGTYVQKYLAVGSNGLMDSCEFLIEVKDAPDDVLQCKSFIQVSLNQICKAVITVEDLLISGSFGCPEDLTVCPKDTTLGIMNNCLTGIHVGTDVIFSVKNEDGNSCWTTVRVEDKLAPAGLICGKDTIKCFDGIDPIDLGLPISELAEVVSSANGIYIVNGVDPCGPVQMTYVDEPMPMSCDDEFQEVRYRTWTAVDPSENTATCRDTICIRRATLADLTLPENYDGITNDPLQCDDADCILPDGSPDPLCTGDPGRLCDNIFTSYKDVIHDICPGHSKVYRTWTLMDWCQDESRTHRQLITIEDNTGPEVLCVENVFVESEIHDCSGEVTLDIPQATDVCSEAELHLVLSPSAQQERMGSSIRFSEMGLGDHEIVWIFKDLCNNQSRCTTIVHVEDVSPPESVCNTHIDAALTSSGLVKVYASSINNGSHDNCNPVYFKVIRMDDESADGIEGGTSVSSTSVLSCEGVNGDDSPYPDYQVFFDDYAKFCCEDIGQNPLVIFRVFDTDPGEGPVERHRMIEGGDLFGHYNDCMVTVNIHDNLPPTISCPRDMTVDCDFDLDNLESLGMPTVYDNCGYRLQKGLLCLTIVISIELLSDSSRL